MQQHEDGLRGILDRGLDGLEYRFCSLEAATVESGPIVEEPRLDLGDGLSYDGGGGRVLQLVSPEHVDDGDLAEPFGDAAGRSTPVA